MSTKRFATISDLSRHGRRLEVRCLACGHAAALDPIALSGFVAPKRGRRRFSQLLNDIADRLRCSQCGAKKVDWGPAGR